MPDSAVVLMQQLHDEHAAALWGYCLRLTGQDHARAEDVVQETLLRAWRNHDRLDETRGSVRAWLFTVARNIVIDEWRTPRATQPRWPSPRCPRRRDVDRPHRPAAPVLARRRGGDVAVGGPPGRAPRVLLPRGVGRAGGAPARHPRGDREVAHALRPAGPAPGACRRWGWVHDLRASPTSTAPTCSARSRPAERLDFERHLSGCARVQPRRARAGRPARACWRRSTSPTSRAGRRRAPAADAPALAGARGPRSQRRRSAVSAAVAAAVTAVAVGALAVGSTWGDDGRADGLDPEPLRRVAVRRDARWRRSARSR